MYLSGFPYLQIPFSYRNYAVRNLNAELLQGFPPESFAFSGHSHKGEFVPVTKTTTATLVSTEMVVLADATGAAFTITLPPASGNSGKRYFIKKIDSSVNAVTVDGDGSETIDGDTTLVLSLEDEVIEIVGDGSNWWVL